MELRRMEDVMPETVQGSVDALEQLEFWVAGTPVPQGSKTGFSQLGSRRVSMVDANAKVLKPWRATVRDAAEIALAGRPGFDTAVYVLLDFYMPRGKTVHRPRPSVKPDIDKLVRAVFDAVTDSGAWADDGLVVSKHVEEWYADNKPGVRVKIGRLA